MRRKINSYLVIIITLITVLAMINFRANIDNEITSEAYTPDDKQEEMSIPDGTGYIFDDFDKGINIPLEDKGKEKN